MKIGPQLLIAAALVAIALPLAGRFIPGARPFLGSVGLLSPMTAIGLIPSEQDDKGGKGQGGWPGAEGGITVIAAAPERLVLRDVITAIGSATGAQSVDLSPGVAGRVVALQASPGDQVAAGDIIATLDAEAAGLALERAKLMLQDAQTTLERLDRLTGSGATTALQRQDAELALRTAELALRRATRDLADHSITAPIAGYIGLIEVQPGDLVTPATVITRIEDRSSLMLEFRVPERVAAQVTPGATVAAHPISTPGSDIAGLVIAVDNRVEEASRTLRVRAAIANTDDAFRAGMAFRITLEFTGAEHPAVDPLAIQWGATGAFVWVVRDGKATRLPIRILQRNADSVLVETALEPGDLVVTEGVQSLRPDAEVTVQAPVKS